MTAPPAGWVDIHYRRLPDRDSCFRQRVVHSSPEVVVTLMEAADLADPVRVGDRVILEAGSPVVWFTYPGRWHDLGRFHDASGRFTGFYANVLTPVRVDGRRWHTTDLCLDVWMGADGRALVLDEDELHEAERRGWVDARTASRARLEASGLLQQAKDGIWPPDHAHYWTLERASSPPEAY